MSTHRIADLLQRKTQLRKISGVTRKHYDEICPVIVKIFNDNFVENTCIIMITSGVEYTHIPVGLIHENICS